jgi:hypothetical protein
MSADAKNKLYFVAAAGIVIGAGVAGWYLFKDKPSEILRSENASDETTEEVLGAESDASALEVSLSVDYGDGQKSEFIENMDEGSSASALLEKAANENSFTVEFQTFDMGRYISAINGKAGDTTHYWGFYANGVMADVGADGYLLKDGDAIEFRYTQM